MPNRMHDGQVEIDEDLVRRLIAQQMSQWSDHRVIEVPSRGTVNAVYRLGDDLCVRLPLLPGGEASLDNELAWLPWLAERLPVAVPEPVAVGEPDDAFPHRWAVYRWLPGDSVPGADASDDAHQDALADDLVALVEAIRALDTTGAPRAEMRWALRHLDPSIRHGLAHLDEDADGIDATDVARTAEVWDAALAAPAYDGPPTWVHGDLLAANLLVADGRLVGVLDWGGSGTGDPASDLYPAWAALGAPARRRFRTALAVDDATWARARGWVLRTPIQGIPYYRDTNPGFAVMGRHALHQVLWGETAADG